MYEHLAVIGIVEPTQDLQKRRLAGTRRTDNRDTFGCCHGHIDALQHLEHGTAFRKSAHDAPAFEHRPCRISPGGDPRRIQGRHQRQPEGNGRNLQHVGLAQFRRQVADEIHIRGQELDTEHCLQVGHHVLQVDGEQYACEYASQGTGNTDNAALRYEYAEYAGRPGADRAQNRDIGLLVLHDHHQGRNDVERCDRDDE